MSIWASAVVLAVAIAACWAGDLDMVLSAVQEIAAVVALFALICAAEARSIRPGRRAGLGRVCIRAPVRYVLSKGPGAPPEPPVSLGHEPCPIAKSHWRPSSSSGLVLP